MKDLMLIPAFATIALSSLVVGPAPASASVYCMDEISEGV